MIKHFSVENFHSIPRKTSIDPIPFDYLLLANGNKNINIIINDSDINNDYISSMLALKKMVASSELELNSHHPIHLFLPNFGNPDYISQPTALEIIFNINSIKYIYKISVLNNTIVYEYLSYFIDNDEEDHEYLVFERKYQDDESYLIELKGEYFLDHRIDIDTFYKVEKHTLLLSQLFKANLRTNIYTDIENWFKNYFCSTLPTAQPSESSVAFLNEFAIDVREIRFVDGKVFTVYHGAGNTELCIDLDNESSGVRELLKLEPLLHAEGFFVLDFGYSALHPLVIKQFLNTMRKKSKCQLLVNIRSLHHVDTTQFDHLNIFLLIEERSHKKVVSLYDFNNPQKLEFKYS